MCEVAQSCLTLCNPMDCRLPGSSVHGILQARILEWVAITFSRGSSQPRNRTQVSCIIGRRFYHLSHQGSLLKVGKLQIMESHLGKTELGTSLENGKIPRHPRERMRQECQRNGYERYRRSTDDNVPKMLPQHHHKPHE